MFASELPTWPPSQGAKTTRPMILAAVSVLVASARLTRECVRGDCKDGKGMMKIGKDEYDGAFEGAHLRARAWLEPASSPPLPSALLVRTPSQAANSTVSAPTTSTMASATMASG